MNFLYGSTQLQRTRIRSQEDLPLYSLVTTELVFWGLSMVHNAVEQEVNESHRLDHLSYDFCCHIQGFLCGREDLMLEFPLAVFSRSSRHALK